MFLSIANRIHSTASRWAIGVGLIALGSALQGNAACLNLDKALTPTAWTPAALHLQPAVYSPGADDGAEFRLVHANDVADEAGIVGLWQFKLSGFAVDWGTQAWHADGTEIMFSGAQNPATGDICQGVWRRVGANTYTLNHIAMGWLAPGGPFGVRVHFHMVVKLDPSHHSFSGSYKASVYSVSPADPFDESVKVAGGTGDVTATRVNPD